MTSNERILQPFTLPNGTELKNRLLMAPMTTCTGYFDGTVTSELVEYYRARAGSIGTIIVECCFIDDYGLAFPGAIGIDNDEKIAGLAKIAEAIKAEGSKAILQIYHGGRMVDPQLIGGRQPVAPSAIAAPRDGAAMPRALSGEEVEGMIAKFGDGVRRAILAGFDGVEIHGANTYLIQQFYSPNSNQRDDEWGGSRDNRARFPLAVLDITHKMARQYADDAFIIGYRFSPEEMEVPGIRFDDTMYLLEKLAARGVDYLHFSVGATLRPSIVDTSDPTPLIEKYCAMRSETLAQVPVMGVGGVVNAADAEQGLDHGYDLMAVGRACIAYPDWASRIAAGEELELFIDSTQREALHIPEPLWRFSLVEAMIRDMSMGDAKFKPGMFVETVQDDANELVINVSLENDRIADIELAASPVQSVEFTTSFEEIRERILTANTPHVDAISGATSQSEAVKKAVSKAMLKSSKALAAEEGGNDAAPKSYDVVVVGSGGAGLAAAIQAHDEGASVLIVEKMPTIGGNTIKASAGMNAAETRFQRVKGIQDSKELFYQETLKGGHNKNNPQLLRRFVENAPQAIEWLADRGIMLNDITTTGGMSIDRTHRPRDGSAVGGYLISGLVRNITKRGIDVLLDTSVEEILMRDDEVSGVRLINDEQEIIDVQTKSIIVATGGFSANSAMVVKYRPDLEGFVTTNHKGATGSGIALLERIGAGTVDMGEIQIHPTVEQQTSYLISESIRGGGAGNIDARQVAFVVYQFVDLGYHNAVVEGGGFDQRRGIFGTWPGVQVAFTVRFIASDQRDVWRQIDVQAGVEFNIGMDGADFEQAIFQQLRDAQALRAGEREIQFTGNAFFKQVQMLAAPDAWHNHMQVVDFLRINLGEHAGEEISLLLVVTFQYYPVARGEQIFQYADQLVSGDDFAGNLRFGQPPLFFRPATVPDPSRRLFSIHC